MSKLCGKLINTSRSETSDTSLVTSLCFPSNSASLDQQTNRLDNPETA